MEVYIWKERLLAKNQEILAKDKERLAREN